MLKSLGSLRRLFSSGATLFGGSLATMGLNFFQTWLLACVLGASGFGIWGTVMSYASVVFAFCTFRTSEPVTRYLVEFRHQKEIDRLGLLLNTAILTDLVTMGLGAVVVSISAPWMAGELAGGQGEVSLYLLYGATQVFGFFDQTWFSVARDLGQYRRIAFLNVLFPALRVSMVGVFALFENFSLLVLAWVFLGVSLIQVIVVGRLLVKTVREGYDVDLLDGGGLKRMREVVRRRKEISGFWNFMSAGFLSSIVSTLVKEGDILVLGILRPVEEVGWYRLGKSLAGMVQRAAEMLAQVIYQDFSEMVVRRDMKMIRQSVNLLWRTWGPTVLVLVLLAVAVAGYAVPILFGEQYSPAVPLFRVLIVGSGVVTILFWVRPMALAFDFYWYHFWTGIVIGVLCVPLNIGLIWLYGAIGAAWTLVMASVFGQVALFVRIAPKLRA
ncbi:putative Lipopolysaccharide biosynthesis protein [Azospirillaceae bacterium]